MVIATSNSPTTQAISQDQTSLPLFEQPLIVNGKRLRKSVTRIEVGTTSARSAVTKRLITGNGVALNDIAKVKQEIEDLKATELKLLHKFLFGTIVKPSSSKQRIGMFKGFTFATNSHEYGKKKTILSKMSEVDRKMINKVLGLKDDSAMNQMIINIMEFLMTPKLPVVIQKRKSSFGGNQGPKNKYARNSVNRLRLSESSFDEEPEENQQLQQFNTPDRCTCGRNLKTEDSFSLSDDDSGEENHDHKQMASPVLKPKKQVTFEDVVR